MDVGSANQMSLDSAKVEVDLYSAQKCKGLCPEWLSRNPQADTQRTTGNQCAVLGGFWGKYNPTLVVAVLELTANSNVMPRSDFEPTIRAS